MHKKTNLKILMINGIYGETIDGFDLLLAAQHFNFKVSESKALSELSTFNPNVVIVHESGNIELFQKILSLLKTKKYKDLFIIKVRDTHDLARPKVKHKQLQYFMQPLEPNEILKFINKKFGFS